MNTLGENFLAGTCLSFQKDRTVTLGINPGTLDDFFHDRAFTNDV